ncbi:hypothetical protein D3C85_1274560 [compost metagenome]
MAIKCSRRVSRPLLRQLSDQRLSLAQEFLVSSSIITALFDQVLQQPRHSLVEPRVSQLLADDGLANVIDNALRNRILGKLALRIELLGNGIVYTSLNDQLNQREIIDSAHRIGGIGLDIGIEQMPHIRFEWLDIQLFAGVFLDRLTKVGIELHFCL